MVRAAFCQTNSLRKTLYPSPLRRKPIRCELVNAAADPEAPNG